MTEIDNEAVEAVARAVHATHMDPADNQHWFHEDASKCQLSRQIARAAIAAMPGWRTIESAPKDGTLVLICGHTTAEKYYVADAKWDHEWLLFHPDHDDWTEPSFGTTHWMPLPAPPKPEGA